MRTVGIIAEYNPLHTGHQYHIQKARELADADYAVVVMSPDFVQRGAPAIFDKYTRTRMALLSGADLVLELPVCYATGSAEYFARGAIRILDAMGCIDAVCFGSETADRKMLSQLAGILVSEPPVYQDVLRRKQKEGRTFPQARAAALAATLNASAVLRGGDVSPTELFRQLSMPNNILALEYCRALQQRASSITPLPILRQGSGYHDEVLGEAFCSATALREALLPHPLQGQMQTKQTDHTSLLSYIPESCQSRFLTAARTPVTADDFLPLLTEKLLTVSDFSEYLDISPELSDRIRNLRFSCIGKSFAEITALLKTRQLTEARIRRALLHLLLGIRQDTLSCYQANGTVFYARLLGFRKSAGPLLHAFKHSGTVPLLAKPSDAETVLRNCYAGHPDPLACALEMLRTDFLASHRYEGVSSYKYRREFVPEYKKSPVIIDTIIK
ncbi:MAG: nucleotidyltransferase family protein [Lachnospiraceae bacterium]|nr:nucleotidyltransferase family protein [Lachnospiraceae bacterium]